MSTKIANDPRGAVECGIVRRQSFGIARGESRDSLLARGEPIGHEQGAPLVDRPEVGDGALDNLQAMAREAEIANYLGIEQAHRVRGDRIAKAGVEFFRHGGAPDDGVLLEHHDLRPAAAK